MKNFKNNSFFHYLIILLFIISLFNSCKSKNRNTEVLEKWENGNSKVEKQIINKADNSYFYTQFYNNGILKSKEKYVKGKLDGSSKFFDEEGYLSKEKRYKNGILDSEYNYKLGKLSGPERIYHPNGQLWTERILLNGKPLAVVSNFDSTGKPMDPGTLQDGYGTIKLYDKNGNLIDVRTYRDGLEVPTKEQNMKSNELNNQ